MRRHAKTILQLFDRFFRDRPSIVGVEVGVWDGLLSDTLLASNSRLTLYMVDNWQTDATMPQCLQSHSQIDQARQQAAAIGSKYHPRSIVLELSSLEAAEQFRLQQIQPQQIHNQMLDFVFIDAEHSYHSVLADIRAWSPLVRVGGIVSGHDYNGVGDCRLGWGVRRAVDEIFGDAVQVSSGRVWWIRKQ